MRKSYIRAHNQSIMVFIRSLKLA